MDTTMREALEVAVDLLGVKTAQRKAEELLTDRSTKGLLDVLLQNLIFKKVRFDIEIDYKLYNNRISSKGYIRSITIEHRTQDDNDYYDVLIVMNRKEEKETRDIITLAKEKLSFNVFERFPEFSDIGFIHMISVSTFEWDGSLEKVEKFCEALLESDGYMIVKEEE